MVADQKPMMGVYALINRESGRVYVGSSMNLTQRLRAHRVALTSGRSQNQRLQNDWVKHGEQAFEFLILQECTDLHALAPAEQFWLDFYAGCVGIGLYNVQMDAYKSQGARHHMRVPRLREIREGRGLTLEGLGQRACIEPSILRLYEEYPHYAVGPSVWRALATALDCQAADLLAAPQEEPPCS